MEELIIGSFFLVVTAYWLQCSLLGKWYCLFSGMFIAVFSYFLYPTTIQQSSHLLSELSQNTSLLQNLAVIQLLETLAFILLQLQVVLPGLYTERSPSGNRRRVQLAMLRFPGLMLFPAIAYFQLQAFQFDLRMDFGHTALLFGAFLMLASVAAPALLKRLLPAEETRLEFKFLVHVFQLATALLIAASAQQKTYIGSAQKLPVVPFLCVALLTLCGAFAGYMISQRKLKKTNKNNGIL